MSRLATSFLVMSFLAACIAPSSLAASEGRLRGFGNCEAVRDGICTEFRCDSISGAECVLGKFLWDLSYNDGAKWSGNVLETAGGAFAFARRGVIATVLCAPTRAEVEVALAADPDLAASCVVKATCPEWMKRFTWGTYGMGGLENFHGWMQKAGAPHGERLDPREDMDFLLQMGPMHFDNWAQPEYMDNSDGILSPNVYWRAHYADEHGIPYSYRLYMPANGFLWMNRRFADQMEQPAPWMVNGWIRYGHAYMPHVSWFQPDGWRYLARQTYDIMKTLKTDRVRGWMHPAGELVHQPWYDMHADYSEAAQRSWVNYLRTHGMTPADMGALDWSQVKVPEFASFTGLPGMILDLAGTWQYSRDGKTFGAIDLPGSHDFVETCFPKMKDGESDPFAKPGSKSPHCLFRRTFDFDAATANGGKVYLYFFPMSKGNDRHSLRLNGVELGPVGAWCGVDATKHLRALGNELEIVLEGNVWNGRIFLSTEAPSMYPRLPGNRNKVYSLWCAWRRDEKAARCEELFDAMRQADPDAPIKFMAPIEFGWPIVNRLMSTWGAFAHFTGEGIWYFPWYKRYGKLWGYQGTSELAGPEETVESMRRSTLRVFLAGLDMHEPVFLTQTYSRNKPVRDWWLQHKPLLNRMGRQDIFGSQVLIYRRSLACKDVFEAPVPSIGHEAGRRVNTPWDWDIGRGTLQSFGASMLYVDDDGISAGKMYGHKVMVDCGNEIMPEERLAEIAEWVRDGGTYVAFPFTGRSTELAGDSWPISQLAGARVAKERPLGGTVNWKGKTYPDSGRSLDHIGRNRVEYSLELEAAGDSGAKPIAFYENGKPAVMERRIGRGRVIWFGSFFWRDAADIEGLWMPGATETAFWRDLLDEVGFPQSLCETSDSLVWAQPYRSNDGLDAVTCLCNFNKDGEQEMTVTMRVPRRPAQIVVYSGKGVETPKFGYADGTVTFTLRLPAQEVAMVNAKGVYGAADALAYWWREQRVAWRSSPTPKLDLDKYRQGRWQDPTQDLKTGWQFEDGRECVADWLQIWGLEKGKGARISKTFDVEQAAEWFKGGRIHLVTGAWVGSNFLSPTRILLNGEEVVAKTTASYLSVDVTERLKRRGNVLTLEFDAPTGKDGFTGLIGSIFLYHRSSADVSMPFSGLPYRLYAPKSWEGKYRVFLHAETAPGRHPPLGVKVRSVEARKHHHNFGHVTDVDITSLLRFGEDNLLEPIRGDKVPTEFRIELYEGDRRP